MPWSSRLHHRIRLADGRVLRSLNDVRAMVLALPGEDQCLVKWQRLADLLMHAAHANNLALTAVLTAQVEETLRRPPFTTARLADDDVKKPPAPSVRRRTQRRRIRKLS